MTLNSRWMPAATAFVVVSMITAMVQPAAFAGNDGAVAKSEADAAENKAAVKLPDRPVLATKDDKAKPAAVRIAQVQPSPTASRTALPANPRPPQQNKGSSKKWIIIAAVAGGAATAAFLAKGSGGDDPLPAATITVGTPTVGGPQ
jgi:hypothetical protein